MPASIVLLLLGTLHMMMGSRSASLLAFAAGTIILVSWVHARLPGGSGIQTALLAVPLLFAGFGLLWRVYGLALKMEVSLDQLQEQLVQLRMDDPDLNVIVRGDAKTKYGNVVNVLDRLQQANVVKVDLATEALTSTQP